MIVNTNQFSYNHASIFIFLALNSTISNSPMHSIISTNYDEEDEVEKDIEILERRLASAKSQLIFGTYQKNKQFKS
jgi:hypothetical protein